MLARARDSVLARESPGLTLDSVYPEPYGPDATHQEKRATVQPTVKNRHFWPDNSRNRRLLTVERAKYAHSVSIFVAMHILFPKMTIRVV
jgi:hypothetical protein